MTATRDDLNSAIASLAAAIATEAEQVQSAIAALEAKLEAIPGLDYSAEVASIKAAIANLSAIVPDEPIE